MKRILAAVCLCVAVAAIVWIAWLDNSVEPNRNVEPAAARASGSQGQGAVPQPVHEQDPSVRVDVGSAAAPAAPTTAPVVAAEVVLTGTLLFEDGAPVTAAHCAWSIQGTNGSVSGRTLTDGEGRFRIPGPTRIRSQTPMLRLRTRWDDVARPWGYAETAIAAEYPRGEHDIGFLKVDRLPLLAAGRVVDATGAPVAGTTVYAMPVHVDLAALADEGYADRLSTVTDAAGRFAVHGSLQGETFLLVARKAGYFQARADTARVGERELTIELAAAGGLAGSVQLDPEMPWQHLWVELSGPAVLGHLGAEDGPVHGSARPRTEGQSLRVPLTADGTFEVGMLRPGSLDCAVRCFGLTDPVASFTRVEVRAGAVARDARLQDIDLRSLRVLTLTIVDWTGVPVQGLAVGVRDVGKTAWERQVTDRGGHVAAATAVGAIDVLVQQGGFERQLLTDVRGERTVTLARGLQALLTFDLGDPVPDFEVAAQLVGATANASPSSIAVDVPKSALQVVETASPIEFRVPGPGSYRLEVTVRVRGGPALHAMKARDFEPHVVEVPAAGISRAIEVKLPQDAVGKVVRQIRYLFPKAGIVR